MRGDIRYTLHGYVCGPNCWRPADNMGTVTFDYIYMHRPPPCRYALASIGKPVIVFDLFESKRDHNWKLYPPEPTRVMDTLDAAIAATEILYEEG